MITRHLKEVGDIFSLVIIKIICEIIANDGNKQGNQAAIVIKD